VLGCLLADLLGVRALALLRYAAVNTFLHDVTTTSIGSVHSSFMMAKKKKHSQSTW
jgi:hypothetical protein